MDSKVLFIGFEDCGYCVKAEKFLRVCGFDVKVWWTPRKRGVKLPADIGIWRGDYIFHMKSYCILPKKLLSQASIAAVNFHLSSPQYPGSGGINWALYNNESRTGVTVHKMNEKVDNGSIIKVYDVPIHDEDTVKSAIERVHFKQLDAFYDIVSNVAKFGNTFLQEEIKNQHAAWSKKVGKIREIERLQTVDPAVSRKELDRIIRATEFRNFGPKLYLHGYEFKFVRDKK